MGGVLLASVGISPRSAQPATAQSKAACLQDPTRDWNTPNRKIAYATKPLGVSPQTWVISAAVFAGPVIIGRYCEAFIDRRRRE